MEWFKEIELDLDNPRVCHNCGNARHQGYELPYDENETCFLCKPCALAFALFVVDEKQEALDK